MNTPNLQEARARSSGLTNPSRFDIHHRNGTFSSLLLDKLACKVEEVNARSLAEITGAIDRSTSAINDNTNKGFEGVKGQFAIAQSRSKIRHRETQNALDRLEDQHESLLKSAKKQERFMQYVIDRELKRNGEWDGSHQHSTTFGLPPPLDVVTATTSSLSRMTGDEVSSPGKFEIRSNLFSEPPTLPSISTTPDNSAAIADASYSEPEANVLKDTNAGLKKELKRERETTASMAVKLRQTEKQLKTWISPRNKKPENVQPLKVPQTKAQRQAEMKYIERRQSGMMEQIKAQKLLESERVPISRRTRSRRRAAENT